MEAEHHRLPDLRRSGRFGHQLGDRQGHRNEDHAAPGHAGKGPRQRDQPGHVPRKEDRADQQRGQAGPPHGPHHRHGVQPVGIAGQVAEQRHHDPHERERKDQPDDQRSDVVRDVAVERFGRSSHGDQHESRGGQPTLPAGELQGAKRRILGLQERRHEGKSHRHSDRGMRSEGSEPLPLRTAERGRGHGDQERDGARHLDQGPHRQRGRSPELSAGQDGQDGGRHGQAEERVVMSSGDPVKHDHRVPSDHHGGERRPLRRHPPGGSHRQEQRPQAGHRGHDLEREHDGRG